MAGKKKVLLVDDDVDFSLMVRSLLEKEGYAVQSAYDGVECMEMVGRVAPDVIVLDVMMPRKDGYQACKELKDRKDTADIPVILLTAVADHVPTTSYSHADAMTLDAEDYLEKPFEPRELVAAVRRLVVA
jgi:two-component system alkaline phosphatase synthesis response regulator PhoP